MGVKEKINIFNKNMCFYSLTEKILVLMQPLLAILVRKLLGKILSLTAEMWGSASVSGTSVLVQLQ